MAKSNKYKIDYFDSDGDRKPKKKKSRKSNSRIFLFVSAAVLVTALVVFTITLMASQQTGGRIVDFGTALKGVKVEGVDISGMTKTQALKATENIEKSKLGAVKFTLSVNGQKHPYGPGDFSVVSDYQQIIDKAMDFGHTGNFDQRQSETKKAASEGKNFTITLSVDDKTFQASLDKVKASLDVAAKDATATFTPWGYTKNTDGTIKAYSPSLKQMQDIVEAEAHGKEYTGDNDYINREKIQDSEMPNKYRYEYYKSDHFEAGYDRKTNTFLTGYIPPNAKIARFYYTPEVQGLSVDMNSAADQIRNEVKGGKYDTITVKTQTTEPKAKIADIKKNTKLITSWTSSYKTHYGYERNWNVAMISALINNGGAAPNGQIGTIIMPGAQWSVNTMVGLRTPTTAKTIGWKLAKGIENGGYTPQYGGGVCQIGSTTYNAAIRAASDNGLKVVSFKHHTIPSEYEPAGLDATLSSPAPDLVIENNGTVPYYYVSYINPVDKNVTVEIYGPSLTDSSGNEIIHTYTSKNTGIYDRTPVSKVIYCPGPGDFTAPDGTIVNAANPTYKYSDNRQGCSAEVWQLVYSLDGKPIGNATVYDPQETYPTIDGTTYQWTGPAATPTTSPTTSPTNTAPPAATTSGVNSAAGLWQGNYPY